MSKVLFLFLLILNTSCPYSQETSVNRENQFTDNDTRPDVKKAFLLTRQSDIYFDSTWIFNSSKVADIDHFKKGIIIEWFRYYNDIRYLRTYTFDLDSQFVRAHEKRLIHDTLISQGDVNFAKKQITYIRQVDIDKSSLKKMNGYWDYEVLGYYFEIFDNGKISCIYRTENLNHYYMLFEKANRNKIRLVKGNDCLDILK